MFLEVRDIVKKYPRTEALKGVNFDVESGTVLGVLGPNGAGKSTLFRIMASVTRATGGSVIIGGTPAGKATRGITAYVPDVNMFYDWMKVTQQMEFLSSFFPGWDMEKTSDLLKFLDIDAGAKIGTLSKGQQAKLKMVFAFSWPAKLVLLDEPLGGIDPPTRKKIVRTLFSEFRAGEQTILIATHLVNEIEELVEDVVFLKEGLIAHKSSADQLREMKGVSLEGLFEEIMG